MFTDYIFWRYLWPYFMKTNVGFLSVTSILHELPGSKKQAHATRNMLKIRKWEDLWVIWGCSRNPSIFAKLHFRRDFESKFWKGFKNHFFGKDFKSYFWEGFKNHFSRKVWKLISREGFLKINFLGRFLKINFLGTFEKSIFWEVFKNQFSGNFWKNSFCGKVFENSFCGKVFENQFSGKD